MKYGGTRRSEEAKKKKARMNLLHYIQLSFKLNFTLSSKYEILYKGKNAGGERKVKTNTLSY